MLKLLGFPIPLVGLFLVSGCFFLNPRMDVEPTTFDHPAEVVKGTDDAERYWVLADRRIFTVMAFLNAVGFDDEARNAKMTALRLKVRTAVAANLADQPEKLREWRRYYESRRYGDWQYANWALSLDTDFPFRRIRPNSELTYGHTAWGLRDLPVILNDFWVVAKLDRVWEDLRPGYAAEIARYDPRRMAHQMDTLWRYLRMPRNDRWTIIHVPNPLQRHFTASANRFEEYFYSIDGPGSSDGGLNVHEYLHTVVNDLVKACYDGQQAKLRQYFIAGQDASISAPYQDPVLWTAECAVHALAIRLAAVGSSNPDVRTRIEARVRSLTEAGYTILRPLYTALESFEESDLPFDRYLPILLEDLPEYSADPVPEEAALPPTGSAPDMRVPPRLPMSRRTS